MSQKQHHFLVHGIITVQHVDPENPEVVEGYMPHLNTLITHHRQEFTMDALAKAHTGLQMRYRQLSGDEKGVVADIIVCNINYLGYMTPEDFQHRTGASTTDNPVADMAKHVAAKAKGGK